MASRTPVSVNAVTATVHGDESRGFLRTASRTPRVPEGAVVAVRTAPSTSGL
ncbi:hypothetical protein [Nesterenkonia suensis]